MYEFHKDRKGYFLMQEKNAIEYVIPYIEEHIVLRSGMRVMEIGCGEGGVLKAFVDKGLQGVGVELNQSRVDNANEWLVDYIADQRITIFSKDIHQSTLDEVGGAFDLIILKDVIEHIFDQKALLQKLRSFLKTDGSIYFGFPPWIMPYGGHQQVLNHKWLSKLPYTHLLPKSMYKTLLEKNKIEQFAIDEMLEIYDTQISTARFESLVKETGYTITDRTLYFINPIYKYKFNVQPMKQWKFLTAIPGLRDFLSTCAYYIIKKHG